MQLQTPRLQVRYVRSLVSVYTAPSPLSNHDAANEDLGALQPSKAQGCPRAWFQHHPKTAEIQEGQGSLLLLSDGLQKYSCLPEKMLRALHLQLSPSGCVSICHALQAGRDRLAAAQSAVPGRGVPAEEKDGGKQAAGGPHPIFG